MDLVDPTLILQDDEKADVPRVTSIALLCSQDAAEERPTMARVVAMLQHYPESEVVVLNSGKKCGCLHSAGKELTTVTETETSALNPRASKRGSVHRGGNLITVAGLIQLSEMRAR
jgi:hypothetical protein